MKSDKERKKEASEVDLENAHHFREKERERERERMADLKIETSGVVSGV